VIVDSFKFLPRTFRPLYEGRGPFPGEEAPVWTPFQKRLADSPIALLTSAGFAHLHINDEAYRAWQPKEQSPVVRKLLEEWRPGA